MTQEKFNISINEEVVNGMTVSKNLSTDVIVTNTDKVEILLTSHHRIIKKKHEWLGPLGIFLSILTTLLTAKFDVTFVGIQPEVWKAIFIVGSLITLGYTIYGGVCAFQLRKQGTITEFIENLKNKSRTQEPSQGLAEKPILKIVSAKYGASDRTVDLLEKISRLVASNQIEFNVTNDLAGIDPYPGREKSLIVSYTINGEPRKKTAKEGKLIRID